SIGDETQHDPFGFCDVRRPEDANSVCFEGGRGAPHAGVLRQSPEPTSVRLIQVRVQFGGHSLPSPLFWWNNLQVQVPYILEWCIRLRMQVRSKPDVKAVFDRLTAKELPGRRGLEAWRSLLRAHATLMRQLDTDLEKKTGLALADFDVLAQLALVGGELRMTDLAERALISRSGMTRRVARLVDEGLVRRVGAGTDGRGVVVALTDLGTARLAETAPVHLRGISQLFVGQLNDRELPVLRLEPLPNETVGLDIGEDPPVERAGGLSALEHDLIASLASHEVDGGAGDGREPGDSPGL